MEQWIFQPCSRKPEPHSETLRPLPGRLGMNDWKGRARCAVRVAERKRQATQSVVWGIQYIAVVRCPYLAFRPRCADGRERRSATATTKKGAARMSGSRETKNKQTRWLKPACGGTPRAKPDRPNQPRPAWWVPAPEPLRKPAVPFHYHQRFDTGNDQGQRWLLQSNCLNGTRAPRNVVVGIVIDVPLKATTSNDIGPLT